MLKPIGHFASALTKTPEKLPRRCIFCMCGLLLVVTGCHSLHGPGSLAAYSQQRLISIEMDGSVVTDAAKHKLAGIRMLSPQETEDPSGLAYTRDIICAVDPRVRVVMPYKERCIVYYRQPVVYDAPVRASGLALILPRTEWKTMNELLIAMGLARYDPTDIAIPTELMKYLAAAQQRYFVTADSLSGTSVHEQDLVRNSAPLCRSGSGYRARLTPADVKTIGDPKWLRLYQGLDQPPSAERAVP